MQSIRKATQILLLLLPLELFSQNIVTLENGNVYEVSADSHRIENIRNKTLKEEYTEYWEQISLNNQRAVVNGIDKIVKETLYHNPDLKFPILVRVNLMINSVNDIVGTEFILPQGFINNLSMKDIDSIAQKLSSLRINGKNNSNVRKLYTFTVPIKVEEDKNKLRKKYLKERLERMQREEEKKETGARPGGEPAVRMTEPAGSRIKKNSFRG